MKPTMRQVVQPPKSKQDWEHEGIYDCHPTTIQDPHSTMTESITDMWRCTVCGAVARTHRARYGNRRRPESCPVCDVMGS